MDRTVLLGHTASGGAVAVTTADGRDVVETIDGVKDSELEPGRYKKVVIMGGIISTSFRAGTTASVEQTHRRSGSQHRPRGWHPGAPSLREAPNLSRQSRPVRASRRGPPRAVQLTAGSDPRRKWTAVSDVTRRSLLLSTAVLGAGVLTGCAGSRTDPAEPNRADTDAYGAGTYNTQEVADELRHIKKNVRRLKEGGNRRILITGSTAGLGQLAAARLLARGHRVVAHARDARRAADVRRDLPGLETVVTGDLRNLDQTRALASQINELGAFDTIIHNAGEYGLTGEEMLNTNSLSPYLLTTLIEAPSHLVYVTSELHLGGNLALEEVRSGGTDVTYDDTKLQVLTLAMAVARRRPDVRVNAVRPGWVPTLMGFHNGPHAPDDLRGGYMSHVWLAEGITPASRASGEFFFHQKPETAVHRSARSTSAQDDLLSAYEERTGVRLDS